MIFIWAFLRNIPILVSHQVFDGFATNTGKALALSGGMFAIAHSLLNDKKDPLIINQKMVNVIEKLKLLSPIFIAIFLIICGVQHFLFKDFVKELVPKFIPESLFWTYFSGLALVAGGLGLMICSTRKTAAFLAGLMIFIWMIMLHIPRVAVNLHNGNEWTGLFETMAYSSILFTIACDHTQIIYKQLLKGN